MKKLKEILQKYHLSEKQLNLLDKYCELLWQENQKINLFSRKMAKDELGIHIFDSLFALSIIRAETACSDKGNLSLQAESYGQAVASIQAPPPDENTSGDQLGRRDLMRLTSSEPIRIADLGSGGGFPAIPVAICLLKSLSSCEFLLVESVKKKAKFLKKAAKILGLEAATPNNSNKNDSWSSLKQAAEMIGLDAPRPISSIKVQSARIEILAHKAEYREKFDFVTARALAPLPVLLEYASGFLKIGGQLIAWKSTDLEQEIEQSSQAVKELKMKEINRLNYQLPENKGKRVLICYQKCAKLDSKYPRTVGLPAKKPL